ncbi:MAG: metal-dependent transcriptional regulator [Turicibacter sp.]|nr:metal-dependent transcriptional regulator [Turicibacter sp.]
MTSNKEEYLRVIYEFGGENKNVPNKLIAEELRVSPSSVTEMLLKMKAEGLIETQPYKGCQLTEAGLTACLNVIRNHRLWEVFLVQQLGYSWREAHEEAHLLEHVATPRLMDRLDDFLGNPQSCPHGFQIPQKNKMGLEGKLASLAELRKGATGIIRRITENVNLMDYLERIGFTLNEEIEIIEVSDYEGPIVFSQGEKEISISYKAAQEVFVEVG